MCSDMASYVNSGILRSICKLKSHVVVWKFRYIHWKVGRKHCVICLLLYKSKSYVETCCFTVNTPNSPFAVGKTPKLSAQTCPSMSKVAHGCVLVSQNGAEVYCAQFSSWSVVVVSRSSWSVLLIVMYRWGKPWSMCGQMYGGHNMVTNVNYTK